MDYAGLYTSLEGKIQEYFKSYYELLNKTTLDYSYGATLISMKNNNIPRLSWLTKKMQADHQKSESSPDKNVIKYFISL